MLRLARKGKKKVHYQYYFYVQLKMKNVQHEEYNRKAHNEA